MNVEEKVEDTEEEVDDIVELTVETVTRRRKVVSTREHLEMGWQCRIDWPAHWSHLSCKIWLIVRKNMNESMSFKMMNLSLLLVTD